MPPSAEEIVSSLNEITPGTFGDDTYGRLQVTTAARRMLARIDTPFEHMWHFTTHDMLLSLGRVLTDMGLWESWREAGGREATLAELCEQCKVPCEPNFLRRLLRPFAAAELIHESGPDRYRPTETALALGDAKSPAAQMVFMHVEYAGDVTRNLPRFLAKTGYKEPTGPSGSNFADTHGLAFWDFLGRHPDYAGNFAAFLGALVSYRAKWTELCNTTQLVAEWDSSSALLVDVGGSLGDDIGLFREKHPDVPPDKLVLQDLPEVVESAKIGGGVQVMAYDFFTPQPVQGSRAYLFHSILHDWEDDDIKRILERVTRAMKAGYSRLLVVETMLAPSGVPYYTSMADINLMSLMAGAERTQEQWVKLLTEGFNLRVVKVSSHPFSPETVLEAERADESGEERAENSVGSGAAWGPGKD